MISADLFWTTLFWTHFKDKLNFESENQIELAGFDEIGTDEKSNSNINDIGYCDGLVQFITQSSNGKVYAYLASLQSQSVDRTPLAQQIISG